jgi:hypothetical protein
VSAEGRLGRAEVFLQWKGTEACYDFYCPCNPEEPQHFDGFFGDTFTCGQGLDDYDKAKSLIEKIVYCGKKWRLPYTLTAAEIEDES